MNLPALLAIAQNVKTACQSGEAIAAGDLAGFSPDELPKMMQAAANELDTWSADLRSAAQALRDGVNIKPMN